MISMMAFSFRYYLRSYRYIAPILIYALSLYFIYSVVPNPVMPSYSLTSSLLFLISVWLGFGFIDVEDETQQVISVLHLGNVTKYYLSKIYILLLITSVMSVITTCYPIIFDKFNKQPTISEGLIALVSHIALSLLGITISFLFTHKLIAKLSYAIIGLFLVVAVTMAGAGIENSLPTDYRLFARIIPPLSPIMDTLNNFETTTSSEIALALFSPLLYSSILLWMFLKLMTKRLF